MSIDVRQVRRALAMVRADGDLGDSAANVCCDLLGELVVSVVENPRVVRVKPGPVHVKDRNAYLGVALVHERVITVRQLKRDGSSQVSLPVRLERVVDGRLVAALIELWALRLIDS
jgi:hypothetical protein